MFDENVIARIPFEVTGNGCRNFIKNLVDRYNLEWIWKTEGGSFIFEHIEGKVKGNLDDVKRFRDTVESIY